MALAYGFQSTVVGPMNGAAKNMKEKALKTQSSCTSPHISSSQSRANHNMGSTQNEYSGGQASDEQFH
jgi:hypothetical protein